MAWWRTVWLRMCGLQGGWGLAGVAGSDSGKVDQGRAGESIEWHAEESGISSVGHGDLRFEQRDSSVFQKAHPCGNRSRFGVWE